MQVIRLAIIRTLTIKHMKTKTKLAEALFEVIAKTDFEQEGRNYLDKMTNNRNIAFNPDTNTIEIQSFDGLRVLHTITIK